MGIGPQLQPFHVLRRSFSDRWNFWGTIDFWGNCPCSSQPPKKDVEKAVVAYRQFATQVRHGINDLVEKVNFVKNFQVAETHVGVQKIINKHTKLFVEEAGTGANRLGL